MHPQICLYPLRKEAEGIKYVHVEFWRGSELSEVKQIQVWKCRNLACQRIFPLTAPVKALATEKGLSIDDVLEQILTEYFKVRGN